MTATPQVSVSRIGTETLLIPVRGLSPLIVHRFSEKAKKQMLDAMQGRKTPKQPKDPEAEFEAAAYKMDDGSYGFPAIGFKAATVGGCRFYGKSLTMTLARQALFFDGEYSKRDGQKLVRIDGTPPVMREDVVRVGMGGSDLRYRPEFTEWGAVLTVTYVTSLLTRDSVLSLVDAGGMGVGVGEWRPERRGDFGTYLLDDSREVEVR